MKTVYDLYHWETPDGEPVYVSSHPTVALAAYVSGHPDSPAWEFNPERSGWILDPAQTGGRREWGIFWRGVALADEEIENAAPPTEFTQRGFAIYAKISDNRGGTLRVQESSAADDSYVWLFAESQHEDEVGHSSIHLGAEGAFQLRDALNSFLKEYGRDDG